MFSVLFFLSEQYCKDYSLSYDAFNCKHDVLNSILTHFKNACAWIFNLHFTLGFDCFTLRLPLDESK